MLWQGYPGQDGGLIRQARDDELLRTEIIRLACLYSRYGYRMIAGLMRNRGWQLATPDRVRRIWREEGLKVPDQQKPRGRLWLNDGSCLRLRLEHRNHVWSYDFVLIRDAYGRKIRMACHDRRIQSNLSGCSLCQAHRN